MTVHYLRHNLNTTTPASHLIVAVSLKPPEPDSQTRYQSQLISRWAGVALRWYRGDQSRVVRYLSQDSHMFWRAVSARVDNARPLWIWTYRAGETMTALRLWDEMDAGRILLAEPDWRYAQRAARSPKARQRKGFIADADPPTIMSLWTSGGQQIKIVDILNWYRGSLPQLAEEMGVCATEDELSSASGEDPAIVATSRLAVVEAVVLGLLDSVHRHDMGVFQATGASQAMQCYRHKFMDAQILIHDNVEARKLERACYYGGRVEPFFVGEIRRDDGSPRMSFELSDRTPILYDDGPIYHLDISGMYPSTMRHKDMPFRLCGPVEGPISLDRLADHAVRRWCAQVTVASETRAYPYRTDKQTLWCTGRFRTALCGPELVLAWLKGDIAAVHLVSAYDCQPLFTRYVDYWWQVRCAAKAQGDIHTSKLAKMMLNSLYGKFGQRRRTWDTTLGEAPRQRWGSYAEHNADTHATRVCRGIAGVLQERHEEEDYRQSAPAISAWITSHGRVLMDELRAVAGERQVYYQCTDGIYVSQLGYNRLVEAEEVRDDELGRLRLVGTADYMRIYGCNDYVFGSRTVRSGVSWTSDEPAGTTVDQQRVHTLRYYLEGGPASQVTGWTEHVRREDPDPRGIVGPDGWVKPYQRIEA